jgi:DNA-binding transcriptional MerR regulator
MLDRSTKRIGASIVADLFRDAPRDRSGGHDYTIRDLARRFGVTLRTLRFYEDKSILKPRRAGRTRFYSERDIDTLELALFGRRAGLTLREIRELRDLSNLREGRRPQPGKAQTRLIAQLKSLRDERSALNLAIEEIAGAIETLEELAETATKAA